MKKYRVIANDDAMKYQVVDGMKDSQVFYENDGEFEAKEICELMNVAYEDGYKQGQFDELMDDF